MSLANGTSSDIYTMKENPYTLRSHPPSAAYYRDVMNVICSTLYGDGPLHRGSVRQCIETLYEGDAVYENCIISARGKKSIADQFALARVLPIKFADEVTNVYESRSFDGGHTLVVDHVAHLYLIPALARDHPQSILYPPSPELTPAQLSNLIVHRSHFPKVESTESLPETQDATGQQSQGSQTLLQYLMSYISLRTLLYAATHAQLRMITRLSFNELGLITLHEDIWGVREVIEGLVPIIGVTLYPLQRFSTGIASSFLAGPFTIDKEKAGKPTDEQTGQSISLTNSEHRWLGWLWDIFGR